jgi:segregation and condensation protein A
MTAANISVGDMPEPQLPPELWDDPEAAPSVEEALVVSLDGFEGPLDVLLALARTQKVDLAKISVLELAEQYLVFIAQAQALRLELAADYLLMAAWLAFLKSKLLARNWRPGWRSALSAWRPCGTLRQSS